MAQKDKVKARAGRELQHPFLPAVVCAILAVGAAVGAFSASGILQVILIVLAVLLSAYTAMLYVAGLLHIITTGFSSRSSLGSAGQSVMSIRNLADNSVFCLNGEHNECPHLHGVKWGAKPFRAPAVSAGLLCKCECHSRCPVSSKRRKVPVQAWRESCTCPGAENMPSVIDRDHKTGQDT